jgi:hypothetical protein
VLKALADECTTGIFFPIDKHATYQLRYSEAGCSPRTHDRVAYLIANLKVTN